ncbi:hypothetical protein ALC56_07150 [Trachymyrmex septentrionalis]|uniref:Uncharacterized protein n=1 Tax=Trachymyrmex septentrionalis TaxID=34720 RepID=A0A151JWH0_9HYME|nr:hypothetical protein ALC56_07150 [Trachymyrmex septentrionalis]
MLTYCAAKYVFAAHPPRAARRRARSRSCRDKGETPTPRAVDQLESGGAIQGFAARRRFTAPRVRDAVPSMMIGEEGPLTSPPSSLHHHLPPSLLVLRWEIANVFDPWGDPSGASAREGARGASDPALASARVVLRCPLAAYFPPLYRLPRCQPAAEEGRRPSGPSSTLSWPPPSAT